MEHDCNFPGQCDLNQRILNPTDYEDLFPIWQCPSCKHLNQFVNTFFETCEKCHEDHTLDWIDYRVTQ
jgi:hypothetical protein